MDRAFKLSDRWDLASYPIARAFALSLLFHFLLFFIVESGHMAGLWKHSFLPANLLHPQELSPSNVLLKPKVEKAEQMPTLFVDTDPAQEAPKPPQDSQFYSSANTLAANPNPTRDTMVPKIEGNQEKVIKTVENAPLKNQPEPTPPAPVQPERQETAAQPEVKSGTVAGDLEVGKPVPETKKEPKPAVEAVEAKPPPRPRTLAAARQQKGIPGERMRQDGGVKRLSLEPSLDVKSTLFGAYDAAFIAAVRARWFQLLDERDFLRNDSGRVVVEFRLLKDGRITDMRVAENEVNDTLAWICQRAVQEPAPFAPFPSDLRRMIAPNDFRDVRFTFHYN